MKRKRAERKRTSGDQIRSGIKRSFILGALLLALQLLFEKSPFFSRLYLEVIYPALSGFLRFLFGWLPFSMGDIFYLVLGSGLLIGPFSLIKSLFQLKKDPRRWLSLLLRFVSAGLFIYLIFILFWGLNYRHDRVHEDFDIEVSTYSLEEAAALTEELIQDINALHFDLVGNDTAALKEVLTFKEIKEETGKAYALYDQENNRFSYPYQSLKPSLFGKMMNYSGVTGYYNPFTGEAQVNTTIPAFSLPFTACHEVAHQLGFSAEEDANFVGLLVAVHSPNLHFRYAAKFSLLLYAVSSLSSGDKKRADSLWNKALDEGIKKDYATYRAFFQAYETPIKPLSDKAYDRYLKANKQKRGIKSYNGVVALVINYKKKYGEYPSGIAAQQGD